ncbi:MAG: DoxX family protein [Prevotella sp.]|nr:DoxX family protein [Prevotella sp.]MDE6690049.1 DoxX family protein [Prevotella sp.]
MKKIIVNLCRLLLAVVFILSGFVKAVDPKGTQYKIEDYLQVWHLDGLLPDFVTLALSVGLSALEFCIGIFLLFAIRRRLTSKVAVIMMGVLTPLTLWLALADPISDCGCFGDALVLTNWQTFWKNAVLLVAAIMVAANPLQMFRFVSRARQWIVMNYTVLFILIIAGWSLYDLPQFDFRPYRIGTDLRTNWQRTMEGEDLPYAEFFLSRADDGEDITEQVLDDEGYTFLLVSPHLEQADDSQLDLINQVYEYAQDYGYPFYGMTASGQQAIAHWRDVTGAEYPFCQTDDITLKTICRSNPGLLLLKDGTIMRKWSHNLLPDEYELSEPLETSELGRLPEDSVVRRIVALLLWFVLPLALLTIADRLWAWTRWVRRKDTSKKRKQ